MSKNHEEVNVLDELSKGACMGRDAIHFIMDKVEDEKLKKELDRQYREYKEISEEIKKYIQNIVKMNHIRQVL